MCCYSLCATQPVVRFRGEDLMKSAKSLLLTAAAALLLALPMRSHAVLELCLDDYAGGTFGTTGLPVLCVFDNLAGDFNPAVGAITIFNFSYGGYILNVSTGVGEPLFQPGFGIDLNSINIGTGNILVATSQNDLSSGAGGPTAVGGSIGGVTSGAGASVSYALWTSDTNNLLGGLVGPGSLAFSGGNGPGAFSNTGGATLNVTDPFSLTSAVLIQHPNGGTTSFNFVGQVPEPAILAILGIAFAGAGFASRRRRGGDDDNDAAT